LNIFVCSFGDKNAQYLCAGLKSGSVVGSHYSKRESVTEGNMVQQQQQESPPELHSERVTTALMVPRHVKWAPEWLD